MEGMETDSQKIQRIKEMALTSDVQQLQSFPGMLNFMQLYISHLWHHTAPHRELLKKNQGFYWDGNTNTVFLKLKTLSPRLTVPHCSTTRDALTRLFSVWQRVEIPFDLCMDHIAFTDIRLAQVYKETTSFHVLSTFYRLIYSWWSSTHRQALSNPHILGHGR